MARNSTFSSQANGLSHPTEIKYTHCPLCDSRDIHLGSEKLSFCRGSRSVELRVERWQCEHCGEAFLTSASRRRVDQALGLAPDR